MSQRPVREYGNLPGGVSFRWLDRSVSGSLLLEMKAQAEGTREPSRDAILEEFWCPPFNNAEHAKLFPLCCV